MALARSTTATRLPTEFAALRPPEVWPPPRGRPRPELLERPLGDLTGVGATTGKRLAKLGLETVGDLLRHRPFRYEQPVDERPIAELWDDEEVAIAGTIVSTRLKRLRRGLAILEAVVADSSGEVKASWFNQSW
ncbi:MAG: hypothetical protein ACR2MU_02505, partial [Gaiellaceae bacterium]